MKARLMKVAGLLLTGTLVFTLQNLVPTATRKWRPV